MNDTPAPPFPSATTLMLGSHVLDLAAGVLRDGQGKPVAMRPQAWAVLCLLARRAGQVVTKEQMLDAVWPGLVVTDGSLAQVISDVRSAFGAEGHRLITTVSRRGYRLVAAPAEPIERPAGPSLPIPPGPLFGRDEDLATLHELLARHRLVTLVGAGGIGKTALALAAAHAHADGTGLAIAWVDLARLADPALLPATLARSLALPIAQGDDRLQGLLSALGTVQALVVLDNAEHLVDAVARIVRAVLDAAAGVRLLVTSQAPLGIEGEHLFRVGALGVPAADALPDTAARAGAVAMFVDRARCADHRFALTQHNAASVIRICRRLDGLPLALRLAAARLPLLGLAGLESRLDERLKLLAADSRDAPTRQQTLMAALDWSHGLLTAHEQALFQQLGVFVGGFTMALAVAVGSSEGASEWQVVDRLGRLVERSMVHVDPGDPPRYRLLESQREYALRALAQAGRLDAAHACHARAIATAFRTGSEQLWSTPDTEWLPHWAPEIDNIRAALSWSAEHDIGLFVSLIGSSSGLFRLLDAGYELRRRAEAVTIAPTDEIDPESAARYWLARSYLQSGVSAGLMHDFAAEAERLARRSGNRCQLYSALCQRATSCLIPAEQQQAVLAEIIELQSADWPPRRRAQRYFAEFALNNINRRRQGELQAAEAGIALAFEAQSKLLTAIFGNAIVVALLDAGEVERARARIPEMRRRIVPGPAGMVIPFIGTCARCCLLDGDPAGARRLLAEMFELCRSVEWNSFERFAGLYLRLALTEGRIDDAARLLGYADAARQRAWSTHTTTSSQEEARAQLAALLPAERLARLGAEGCCAGEEQICRWALAET